MTWKITPGWTPADSNAAAYIAAVEAADGQALENGVKVAIDNFVLGCKADGIWNAIKASCVLAGARTLNGALIPLSGTAPTNFNFATGDYNRKTGLAGDGSSKYLNSNRLNNADPQNSQHVSAFISTLGTNAIIGVTDPNVTGSTTMATGGVRSRNSTAQGVSIQAGFNGISRSASDAYTQRLLGVSNTITQSSQAPSAASLWIYRSSVLYGSHRCCFYSIGESLDLAILDARVTTLINAIAAAIP